MIEPARFEPAMPANVRDAIAAARKTAGPINRWYSVLDQRPWGESFVLLRTPSLPADVVGWLTGMAMFADDLGAITDVAEREGYSAPVAAMLAAFVAGLRAGVPLAKHQWKRIEILAKIQGHVPDALRDELPRALVSDSAIDRGVGLRLVQRSDARAVVERARDTASGKARKRLDEALAALDGAPQADATLRAKSKAELEVVWLARAARRDPSDLDALLGTPWPGAWKPALARIRALAKFPPDARIAAILPRIRGQHTSFGAGSLRRAIDAMLPAHDRVAPAPKPPAASVDELWRGLRERPSDLAVRAVLADALQASGDPRGEYIALSLAIAAGTADGAAKKRASRLLAAHVDTWSAGIPGALRASRTFERGFLTAVECKTTIKTLRESLGEPAWWTVEELHLESDRDYDTPHATIEALLAAAPALEVLVMRSWAASVFGLAGAFPRVRVIGTEAVLEADKLGAFPELAMVGVSGHTGYALERATGVRGLLVFDHQSIGAAVAAYNKNPVVPELRIASGRRLEMDHRGWLVRVRKGDARAELSWGVGKYTPGALKSYVDALVSNSRGEVAISPPSVGRAAFDLEAATIKNAKLEWLTQPVRTWRV